MRVLQDICVQAIPELKIKRHAETSRSPKSNFNQALDAKSPAKVLYYENDYV